MSLYLIPKCFTQVKTQSLSVGRYLWLLAVCHVLILFCLYPSVGHGLQPLELTAQTTRDLTRAYDGIDNANFERFETHLVAPLVTRRSYVGNWLSGFEFTENRLYNSGITQGVRRLYRLSTPVQFFPHSVGRFQHEWMFAPAYYSDESLTGQTRFTFEYAWQLRYRKNRKFNIVAGLRNDSRFGGMGIYPLFGIEARPNSRIYHHWVFPDMYSEIQLNKRVTAKGFLQVNGGNWRYLLSDKSSTSTLGLSDWKLGAGLRLKTRMPFDVVAQVGLRILGQGAMAGTTGSLENSFFISIGIKAPFELGPMATKRRR